MMYRQCRDACETVVHILWECHGTPMGGGGGDFEKFSTLRELVNFRV